MNLSHRSVLVIGAGGLGCPSAVALAAAGVGRLTVMDDDRVDETNLARQMLYGEDDVGALKAKALANAIQQRFPSTSVRVISSRFDRSEAAHTLVREHDLVIDGSDNFATRFLANDLCVELRKPLIHGAAIRWQGQVLTIIPGETPCLRCLFEGEPPPGAAPTCAEAGVISPLVGVIGGWMAQAAISVLQGIGEQWEIEARWRDPSRALKAAPDLPQGGGASVRESVVVSKNGSSAEPLGDPARRHLSPWGRSGAALSAREGSAPAAALTPNDLNCLRTLDALTGRERLVPVGRDPDCAACGKQGR